MRRHSTLLPAAYAIVAVAVIGIVVLFVRLVDTLVSYAQRTLDALPTQSREALWRELNAS